MRTLTLKSWSDIHRFDARRWIWRGHREAGWEIQTSLERLFNRRGIKNDRVYIERELFREFQRTYHHWGGRIPDAALQIEWASIMQHHGAPTRLTDFSYSIYVAAYFALEEADGPCAVIGIDGNWAALQSCRLLEARGKNLSEALVGNTTEEIERLNSEALFTEPFVRCLVPANPFRMNERLRIQKGVFLIPGDPNCSFAENLEAMPPTRDKMVKIIIPAKIRTDGLESLFYMNISRTNLFPGLDGYARSLAVFHPSFNPKSQYSAGRK